MSREALFSYLAAFVTVILALAMSDMIQSLHRLIRARNRVRWAALPLIAAVWVYLGVLSGFFSLWRDLQLQSITYVMLVWQTLPPTLLALLAFAALPDEVPSEGLDLASFYEDNRRYLVLLIAIGFAADMTANLIHYRALINVLDPRFWWSLTQYYLLFAMCGLLWSGPSRWRQYLGWAGLFVSIAIGYLGWVARAA